MVIQIEKQQFARYRKGIDGKPTDEIVGHATWWAIVLAETSAVLVNQIRSKKQAQEYAARVEVSGHDFAEAQREYEQRIAEFAETLSHAQPRSEALTFLANLQTEIAERNLARHGRAGAA